MTDFTYDLHLHSCLSPCGDGESTPHSLAGMGKLCGLQIMALTDHNTTRNCPAFFEAAREMGIVPVAGMELTTAEDIHLVCLFPTLEAGMAFGREVDSRRVRIPNRPDIFGAQTVMNERDEIVDTEDDLLINATTIPVEEADGLCAYYGGVCYPAHIDRESGGIIAVLGDLPPDPPFTCVELHDLDRETDYRARYALGRCVAVTGSDAHYLWDIRDGAHTLPLEADPADEQGVRDALLAYLRKGL
ncbi:MAG: PHP domain-containing protein [Ruminococcaceae bacterium]|nr:PHP domain-containing protein [Oscillospiraceae bacterium]